MVIEAHNHKENEMHALFDPNSDYNKMRSEFDPRDKVYGYFLSLKFESERQDLNLRTSGPPDQRSQPD